MRPALLLHLVAAVTVVLALVAGARPAAAEDAATKRAKQEYAKGEKLFALGRFEEALVAYEAAFEAKPLPGFLFNIGQCHRNLKNYDAAIFSFRKYLKLRPDAENRDAVLGLIDELEDARAAEAEARAARRMPPAGGGGDGRDDRRDADGRPIYKKWWFWGGVAAVAGASAGAYFLFRDDGVPDSDLGNVVFR